MAKRVPLSPDLLQKIINSPTFQAEVSSYQRKTGIEGADAQQDVAQLVYRTFFRPNGDPKNTGRMSKNPGKSLARYLEKIGLREEGAIYKVGETPKEKRGRR